MPTIIRRNERSWAISMISDINIKLQSLNLRIIRAGGETTISTGHQSMFPDVLLYGDENQTQILQGWELKLPDTPITDTTFKKKAKRKAAIAYYIDDQDMEEAKKIFDSVKQEKMEEKI